MSDQTAKKQNRNTFSDIETNVILIVILFVIILLFWVPIAEIVK